MQSEGRRPHPAFSVAAFALAFLLTISYTQQKERTQIAESRREDLASLVVARQRRAARLESDLASLHRRANALRIGDRGPVAGLQAEIARLGAAAGTTPVTGPGLRVTMTDSPLADQEGSADFLIQDVDVQLVVNELWGAGAEAIAINGRRIVATTAIRSAGGAILINYKVLTSPYRIEAIGDAARMRKGFAASEVAARFQTWSQVYRLGMEVGERGRLSIPAFAGGRRLTYASPLPSPQQSAGSP